MAVEPSAAIRLQAVSREPHAARLNGDEAELPSLAEHSRRREPSQRSIFPVEAARDSPSSFLARGLPDASEARARCQVDASCRAAMFSLRYCHQLKEMTIGDFEINALATAPIIDLGVVSTPRCAAVDEARVLNPTKNGVEFCVGDVECVVMTFEVGTSVTGRRLSIPLLRYPIAEHLLLYGVGARPPPDGVR